jgi:hypothetical protein
MSVVSDRRGFRFWRARTKPEAGTIHHAQISHEHLNDITFSAMSVFAAVGVTLSFLSAIWIPATLLCCIPWVQKRECRTTRNDDWPAADRLQRCCICTG